MKIRNTKTLFFTTSPRSPLKMIPEIKLLCDNFGGRAWDSETQKSFMMELSEEQCFSGGNTSDLALSARDRINRSPKALGFVDLKPVVKLTDAGEKLLSGRRTDEVFLRQLLKFQLPSPYHQENNDARFYVKPYLEMIRLIDTLGYLTFDELRIFGLQLTDYNKFDTIVAKIQDFRNKKIENAGKYKQFFKDTAINELRILYSEEIETENFKVRENKHQSEGKFLDTKLKNSRDYADACFRYLQVCGLVSLSQHGRSLTIIPEKQKDVKYILENVSRAPQFVDDEEKYKEYLFNSAYPVLYSDNKDNLSEFIKTNCPRKWTPKADITIDNLKNIRDKIISDRKNKILEEEVASIKAFEKYDDILSVYEAIISKEVYDQPLMLEWNTWRAMTMINGGKITGNFKVDDYGNPISTAVGNMADIVCDYGEFGVTVEVTLQSGQRQYETESEPVTRHLGKFKQDTGKCAFCIFIAQKINPAAIAYFFMQHKVNISYYGGRSIVIPLELNTFIKMIENVKKVQTLPTPENIRELGVFSKNMADKASSEVEWFEAVKKKAECWLIA